MISEPPQTAFVWIWLPGHNEPVVAGRVDDIGPFLQFTYGRRYLQRDDAVPLYLPELPLQSGPQQPPVGFDAHGCIRDAAPDAWGQRVILHRLLGRARDRDTAEVGLLTYLLASGPDRIGALDFQESPEAYTPRATGAPLEQLIEAADRVQAGQELPDELDRALLPGSSVGGARPKALLNDQGRALIAKFSAPSDTFPWMGAEAVAMDLAARAGLNVARTRLTQSMGHDVLLVERFDRVPDTNQRRMVVSALTVLGLHEMLVRHGSYAELADIIRHRFSAPSDTLRELFARIVFNVLVGNTDDHPRNHAAFWDGRQLTLTPAYDIAPQPRSGGEAAQGMAIGHTAPSSDDPTTAPRLSQLAVCLQAADTYQLDPHEARDLIDRLVTVVREQYGDSCEAVGVPPATRGRLWGREIFNPSVFEGYRPA
jgi:serine/threonine-protein kinase HipA